MQRAALFTRALIACAILVSSATAQTAKYDPYAPQVDEAPPVAADGSLHWPSFYKSQAIEMRYESLWMRGACRGTNKRISVPAEQNRVSIDAMTEGKIQGRVLQASAGVAVVQLPNGVTTKVVTHPAGVSRVGVDGNLSRDRLSRGMCVRFMAEVKVGGVVDEPVDSLAVVSIGKDVAWQPITLDERQMVVARITKIDDRRVQLRVDAGTLRRVTIELADSPTIQVVGQDLSLASPGDELIAKGHLYDREGKTPEHLVFASDVEVHKPPLATTKPR